MSLSNKILYDQMSMESRLSVIVWSLIGTSFIPILQSISLFLAIIVSLSAIFLGYPKIVKRVNEIKSTWKHQKKD